MFKIITTKKYEAILEDRNKLINENQEIRRQHTALHQLYKGLSNKYTYELGVRDDTIKILQSENKKLKSETNRLRESLKKASKR